MNGLLPGEKSKFIYIHRTNILVWFKKKIVASCFPNKQNCFWKSYFSYLPMQKLPKWHLQTWALQCPWLPAQDPQSVSLLSSSPNNSCFCASKQTMTLVLLLQSRNHSSASSLTPAQCVQSDAETCRQDPTHSPLPIPSPPVSLLFPAHNHPFGPVWSWLLWACWH